MAESMTWGMWGLTEEDAEIEAANELEHDQRVLRYEQDDHWRWLKAMMEEDLEATMENLNLDLGAGKMWLYKRHLTIPAVVIDALLKEHVTDCPHIFRDRVIEEALRVAELEDK